MANDRETQKFISKIGGNLKKLRIARGYSQGKLAKLINTTGTMVSQWETGFRIPSIGKIIKFCLVLDTTIDSMVGFTQYAERLGPVG